MLRNRLASLVALSLVLVTLAACETSTRLPSGTPESTGLVVRVADGDTVRVRLDAGDEVKVRFIGVDTPESTFQHEPYGKEASRFTKRELLGKRVWLELDVGHRDRYDRLLAYVWTAPPGPRDERDLREHMFNARLLVEGYAQMMTVPPNVAYADRFRPLQAEARREERGLWALPAEDRD